MPWPGLLGLRSSRRSDYTLREGLGRFGWDEFDDDIPCVIDLHLGLGDWGGRQAQDFLEPSRLGEYIANHQADIVGRGVGELRDVSGVSREHRDPMGPKLRHDDFLADLVRGERHQRRNHDRIHLSCRDNANDRLQSFPPD